MSLAAPAAPDLMETTGHFPSNISLTASASASPSVIVIYLPPALNACWPNNPESSKPPVA